MPVKPKPYAREDAQDLPRLHQAVSGGTRGSDYQTPQQTHVPIRRDH